MTLRERFEDKGRTAVYASRSLHLRGFDKWRVVYVSVPTLKWANYATKSFRLRNTTWLTFFP